MIMPLLRSFYMDHNIRAIILSALQAFENHNIRAIILSALQAFERHHSFITYILAFIHSSIFIKSLITL